jgi:hypothetical protein
MWPDDDDEQTQAAIEKKIGEVFRYAKFETSAGAGRATRGWSDGGHASRHASPRASLHPSAARTYP